MIKRIFYALLPFIIIVAGLTFLFPEPMAQVWLDVAGLFQSFFI